MAPRGRRRKVGLMRFDAALDAMRPLGFPDDVVRKSVKDLLKVYGGDAGWAFIEEAAYKVLIDTILEVEEQPQHDHVHEEEEEKQQREGESHEQVECVPDMRDKDICEQQERMQYLSEEDVFDKEICEQEKREEDKIEIKNCLPLKVHFAHTSSLASVDSLPMIRRHKPCYGWISDDEDEDEFILLTPAKCTQPD